MADLLCSLVAEQQKIYADGFVCAKPGTADFTLQKKYMTSRS